jgi:hypothetical protein
MDMEMIGDAQKIREELARVLELEEGAEVREFLIIAHVHHAGSECNGDVEMTGNSPRPFMLLGIGASMISPEGDTHGLATMLRDTE